MKVTVPNYSTDGSSLSEERCQQICLVYDLCNRLGDRLTSYKDIQNIAVEEQIFGSAKADSVIRTIFPLLKKLGFVSYPDNGEFKASSIAFNARMNDFPVSVKKEEALNSPLSG